jgi:excisionase family DNA binding protein
MTLNIEQAAVRFKVTRRTIYNWIRAGKLIRINTPLGPRVVVPEQ